MRIQRYLASALVIILGTAATVSAQLPRPPKGDLALQFREFPIPFDGYNQAYCNVMAFSKDGTLLATGAESNLIVWDVETRKVVTRMQLADKQYAVNVAFTDDGKTLVYNGHDDPVIRFFDVKTGRQTKERPHANAPKEPPAPPQGKSERSYRNPFVAFLTGAKLMAVYDTAWDKIDIVDLVSGKANGKLDKAGSSWRGSWTISRDGKLVASSSSWQLEISIWNAQTGELVRSVGAKTTGKDKGSRGFTSLRFSHDGKYVFGYDGGTGQNDHNVVIFGVDDGLLYCKMPMWASPGAMSPDGRMFVAGSGGRFFLYDLLADKVVDIKLPTQHFYHVEPTPDGKSLALHGTTGDENRKYSIYLASFPVLGDDALTPPLAKGGPGGVLTEADQADLWTGLCSHNLFRRRYVTKVLKTHADQAVALAESRVKPVAAVARQRVVDLIEQLDDDNFEKRDTAMKELRAEAFRFEPLLDDTLKAAKPGEVRNRIAFILTGVTGFPTPAELLSELRGIELLETLGTPAAQKVLQGVAGGAAGARTTTAAAQALKNMEK